MKPAEQTHTKFSHEIFKVLSRRPQDQFVANRTKIAGGSTKNVKFPKYRSMGDSVTTRSKEKL